MLRGIAGVPKLGAVEHDSSISSEAEPNNRVHATSVVNTTRHPGGSSWGVARVNHSNHNDGQNQDGGEADVARTKWGLTQRQLFDVFG